ncbi:GntR family transcriptional regulator [Streptomyces sp. NPDC059096]|uniref:GntR family transcriptional regulator n=1 Tax=Streptomyces sp. NPDC059096 TaxID=3346727 RepID=UPI0036C56972
MSRYGISRFAARWILDRLRDDGLIETRCGSGSRAIGESGPIWSRPPDGLTGAAHIEQTIRLRIAQGTYPVGGTLPSIDTLAVEFSFARCTVATALRPLRRDGLIEFRRGLGTFVLARDVDRTRVER